MQELNSCIIFVETIKNKTMSTFETTNVKTFKEDDNTIWFLETRTHLTEGRKLHFVWCESFGKEIKGTRKMIKRLSKDWKSIFNIK